MAVIPSHLDSGVPGRELFTGFPTICALQRMHLMQRLVPETGGFEALSHLAGKVCQASSGVEGLHPAETQEFLWQQFFSDSTKWWDNRRNKPNPRYPDFKHKVTKLGLWLDSRRKPAWVDSQLATWDDGMMKISLETASVQGQGAFAAHEGHLEVGMCKKLCDDGRINDAVDVLNLLVQRSLHVPSSMFYRLLKRCIASKDLVLGRRIHALSVESGYEGDDFLATHFIGLYASHGRLEEAMQVFNNVSAPSSYSWATIIFAYAKNGEGAQAIELYRKMRKSSVKPDNRIYVAVLKACASARDIITGKEVHAHILASAQKPDSFVKNGLVDMYAKCGSLVDARKLFDGLAEKNMVTWNAMLTGYAQRGMGQEALCLYRSMQQEGLSRPSSVTFICLLQACASLGVGALPEGKKLHAQIEERGLKDDVVLGGSLVNMYAKCGSLEDARSVFNRLPERNMVTWNAMLAGYTQQGLGQVALSLYDSMQDEGLFSPDPVTYVSLLLSCASVGAEALQRGKQFHAQIEERGLQDDVIIGCSLVNMYAKCGCIEDARSVFDRLPGRDVVTWNAMLAGYAQQGMVQKALSLYNSMQEEALCSPDSFTFVCLLQACATVAALPLGKQLHEQIKEQGLQTDVAVGGTLVNMYAKCGCMSDSQHVFDSLSERSIEAWAALISGYARHGESDVVFDLLDRMGMEGVQPTEIIFLTVLKVCSHVGLVDKGRKYFEDMETEYGITPTVDHYTCMMDLLGRAGHLDEALQMAQTMPFPPDGAVWRTLLGACRKWNNIGIGQQAFELAVRLDGNDAASYVLMANIYARARMWDEAKEMQARRLKFGAWKEPGQSWWTDMAGVVHTFVVGDKTHPDSEGIYDRLEKLVPKLKNEGYVPHLDSSLRDIPDCDKEAELCGHSEKLAIAYALNMTPQGTTIRVVKNLRVCEDCHAATAYISKVEKRTIICRDASRFHVYKEGKCSCRNYW